MKNRAFNSLVGPEGAETVIAASGPSAVYAIEAVHALGLDDQAAVLKIGASFPLPEQLVVKHLSKAKNVIVYEEVEPFLEDNLKIVMAGAALNGVRCRNFTASAPAMLKAAAGRPLAK